MEIVSGTATCPVCGDTASVIVQDGELHLTCDNCTYEMWGAATETTGQDVSRPQGLTG